MTQMTEKAPDGRCGDYYSIKAKDWVVIVAMHGKDLVLVRQWRHGAGCLTLELPGGVCDRNEDPKDTAKRELFEETGYLASSIKELGTCYSNPALFSNRFHVFLAEDLLEKGEMHPDDDEYIQVIELPFEEVFRRFGRGELTHAYMGTALMMAVRHQREKQG
jgi:ADP-ribose pyrophosphatase